MQSSSSFTEGEKSIVEITLNETKLYKYAPKLWSYVVLLFVSVSFLVSDWAILYSSFGDFGLVGGIFFLVILGKIRITKKQTIIIISVFSILAVTVIVSYLFNDADFVLKRATLSSIKLIFYTMSLIIYYNFILINKLKEFFLYIINYLAIFTVILGITITILIYFENFELPEFLWTFTRQDTRSYYFAGSEEIVRTRSLFSEPAHLGYFLNIVFFSNLFYKKGEANKVMLFIIGLGIVATYSYSMILVFSLTLLAWLTSWIMSGDFSWSYWYLTPLILIGALILYFWEFIDITIIERTRSILDGGDGSANTRLFGSWMYINSEQLIYGNGIGHTPPITNIYAYVLSDFGLLGFIPYIGLTIYIIKYSIPVAILFVTLNMAKGGYLNPAFWLFLLFMFIYSENSSLK